ncbi:iron complex transport system substrate-binding protein [Ferrimonas sediminum]|uniref:Iron complex transport system substrate-binding protein n=1 Tax=Ferrimonas sediminum TaxID=718193 RepID=A0A1G8NPK0_9GAMM|nr:ABC transporter substrate-binding protein [Ferrimonas sediminum]SDI81440.1 iron complex transport system substrate-binding protein [Ferrimonas sediminum]
MNHRFPLTTASLVLGACLSLSSVAAERVVSAGAAVTELVVALQGADKLVAVDVTSKVPEGMEVPMLGYHRTLSAEGILSMNPDLLVGSDEMGPKATLNIIRQADVEVANLPAAETPEQLLTNIDTLAGLLASETAAPKLKAKINEQVTRITDAKKQLARSPRVVFVLLRGDRGARLGGHHTPADMLITLAGGTNVAGFDGYKSANEETLLALEPEMILVTKPSMDDDDAAKALLESLPLLAHTPAGKNGHILNLPAKALLGGLGPSALDAAENLARQMVEIR